jgi:hypothetical protein
MSKETKCVFCGSKSLGKGCPWSHFKNKVHLHSGDPTKCSFCGSPTKVGPGCPHSPTGFHMAGANFFNNMTQESFIIGYLMKKLQEPIYESQAFLKGIIDANGNLVKHPETIEERSAFTPVDAYILKLKSMLGNKIDLINHKLVLEKVIQAASIPIELYEKEVQLRSKMDLVIQQFNEICNEASGEGLPLHLIEKILLESFTKSC